MEVITKMFCVHCGKEIPDDVSFCPYCGGEIKPVVNQGEAGGQYQTESLLGTKVSEMKSTESVHDIHEEKIPVKEAHNPGEKNKADKSTTKKRSGALKIVGIIAIIIFVLLFAVIAIAVIATPDTSSSNDESFPEPITAEEFVEIANDLGYAAESHNEDNKKGVSITFDKNNLIVFYDYDTVKDAYSDFDKLEILNTSKMDSIPELQEDDSGTFGEMFSYAYYSADYDEDTTYYIKYLQYGDTLLYCNGFSDVNEAFEDIMEKSGYAKVLESYSND